MKGATFQETLRNVEPWDACADGAQQIRSYSADAARYEVGGMNVLAVNAVYRANVTGLHPLNVSNVDHGYVHGDDSNDRGKLSANQNASLVAQGAVYPIGVACRKNPDHRWALGNKFAAVADAGTCGDVSQAHDAGAQAHDRLEREYALGLGALLDGIVAGVIAIQDDAGAHHVSPGFRPRGNGRAVGEMHYPEIDTQAAQAVQRDIEVFFLFPRLLTLA